MAEMTVRNARKLLAASPLTFGDEEQIRAVRLIEMAEEYRDLVECSDAGHEDCPECDGSGETECLTCGHEEACDVCDGTGEVSSLPIEVSGISLATAPELFAAIEKFKSIISAAA